MTGSPTPGTPPRTDVQWARTVEERLANVETGPATRVGDWVIYTHPDSGNLVASNVNGGTSTVLPVPTPSADPDAVSEGFPILRVQRQAILALPSNDVTVTVPWDSVDIQIGPWGIGGSESFETITIPEDGIYRVIAYLAYATGASSASRTIYLLVDGTAVNLTQIPGSLAQPGPSVTDLLSLSAGQTISVLAGKSGSLTTELGPHPTAPLFMPSLSIERIR